MPDITAFPIPEKNVSALTSAEKEIILTALGAATSSAVQLAQTTADNAFSKDFLVPKILSISSGFISWNYDKNSQPTLTLTSDATLRNPTNMPNGWSGSISGVQDAVGGRALSLANGYLDMSGQLSKIALLGPGKAFEISVKRIGAIFRVSILTEP